MMLTEQEAREKWCPWARSATTLTRVTNDTITSTDAYNLNRVDDGAYPTACRCIASDCMAWQWQVGPPTTSETAPYDETDEAKDWRGFCGLAGQSS